MAQPDWTRGDLSHNLRVIMVDPYNLKDVRGEVSYVERSGRYSLDYYADTRMGASLTLVGAHGWDGISAIRLVHEVSDYTGLLWEETLGTFYVTADGHKWEWVGDTRVDTLELKSTLYGMETNVTPNTFTIGKNAKALSVLKRVCKIISRPHRVDKGTRDAGYSKAVTYPPGTSYLSICMKVCDKAGDRVDVARDGTVVFHTYTPPSKKSPAWYDDTSVEGTLISAPFSGGDAKLAVPERVVVSATGKEKVRDGTYQRAGQRSDGTTYKKGDPKYKEVDKTITATAVQPSGHLSRHAVRGFCIDDFIQLSDMSPFTQSQADKLAKQYLKEASELVEEASCTMGFRPLREGDVFSLTHAGETRRWQIASADLDLNTFTWSLQLKGGWK